MPEGRQTSALRHRGIHKLKTTKIVCRRSSRATRSSHQGNEGPTWGRRRLPERKKQNPQNKLFNIEELLRGSSGGRASASTAFTILFACAPRAIIGVHINIVILIFVIPVIFILVLSITCGLIARASTVSTPRIARATGAISGIVAAIVSAVSVVAVAVALVV